MGLTTWSISVRRRIRDAIARLDPKHIIQTGSGIGHLSAWILDHFDGRDGLEKFQIVEEGNKFIGKKRGLITTDNNIKIEADEFIYDKSLNTLKLIGNILINDLD